MSLLEQVQRALGYTPDNTAEWYLRNLLESAERVDAYADLQAQEQERAREQERVREFAMEHNLSERDAQLLHDYGELDSRCVAASLFRVLYQESAEDHVRALGMLAEMSTETVNGAYVTIDGYGGYTILQYACSKFDSEMIRDLLAHGADPNLAPGGIFPLEFLMETRPNTLECTKLLLDAGARLPDKMDWCDGFNGMISDVQWTPARYMKLLQLLREPDELEPEADVDAE